MKRIISIILLVTMMIGMLAGCGGKNKDDKKENNDETKYSISLDEKTIEIYLGESADLTATVSPSVDKSKIKWKSSDNSVATVDGGRVYAVAEGEATITASYSGASASCNVTVLPERPETGNKVGNQCPSYGLELVDGSGKINIKSLEGKIVVINFWGTWCDPCKEELPDFDRIATEYSDDVVVLAIHSTQSKASAPEYINKNFPSSKMIFAYDTPLSKFEDMYYDLLGGTGGYPRTLILDKRGVITYTHEGKLSFDEIKEKVDKILNPNSGSNPPASSDSVVGYDGSKVTIEFYSTIGSRLAPILESYVAEFNKLYPNIEVINTSPGGYDEIFTQIKAELTVGNSPNIAYCYPEHVAVYNKIDAVVSLDKFINSSIPVTDAQGNTTILGFTDAQKEDFIPGFYAEGAVYDEQGTMYTLPFSKSTDALFYNKTFFDNHGLKVPTTWDEMEQVCAQIKEIDPNCVPFSYDSEANWFISMCIQSGEDLYISLDEDNHFLFDNPTARAFVERFRTWYDKGYFTTSTIYGGYSSNLFVEERCYMVIGSTGGASFHQSYFETGIATVPQVDPSNPKIVSQGPSLCIFDKENPQEVAASWLFVEFLTTNSDFQAEISMASGYAPAIRSAQNNPTYKAWLNSANGYNGLTAMSVKHMLSLPNAYYTTPAFYGSYVAREQVASIMINVFSSSRTDVAKLIDDEFKRAIFECNYATY